MFDGAQPNVNQLKQLRGESIFKDITEDKINLDKVRDKNFLASKWEKRNV